tara:strand:- start:39131 stop:39517 length:387 start_codon:yes stop_codon:yes gene_type:complete
MSDLKALSDAATDGPWRVEGWDEEADEISPPYTIITECGAGAGYDIISASAVKSKGEYARDPEYIAALVNAHRAGQIIEADTVSAQLKAADELAAAVSRESDNFGLAAYLEDALTAYRATKPTPEGNI